MWNKYAPRQTLTAVAIMLCGVMACHHTRSATLQFGTAQPLNMTTTVGTTPMFAVSPSGQQTIAWVSAPGGGTDGRLYISVNGRPAIEIRDSLGPIEAHGEAPPELAYATDSTLYALYIVGKVVPGDRFPLSALRLIKSTDDGMTWNTPITVTGPGDAFGGHSFHALHVTKSGLIYVSWLGESSSWITHSPDGGTTWLPPVQVDSGHACPCCRTALATAPDGTVYMAWRHVYPQHIRDIVVARSTDQGITWSTPVRVHADNWQFDACPHAGPSIAVDAQGTVHVAWWTGKEGEAGVFYAHSTDRAQSFSAPVPLGVAQFSQAAHVQLALASPHRVVVTWDDGTRQIPRVMITASRDDGEHFSPVMPLSASGAVATFPVLGISGDSIAVAWSQAIESAAKTQAAQASASNPQTSVHTNMHHMDMPKGLDPVGNAQVVIRRGVML